MFHPKCLEDIDAIASSQPHLEKERIQYWVEQFGEALELPDLWAKITKLLRFIHVSARVGIWSSCSGFLAIQGQRPPA